MLTSDSNEKAQALKLLSDKGGLLGKFWHLFHEKIPRITYGVSLSLVEMF